MERQDPTPSHGVLPGYLVGVKYGSRLGEVVEVMARAYEFGASNSRVVPHDPGADGNSRSS